MNTEQIKDELITFQTSLLAKEKGFTLGNVGSHRYNYYQDDGQTGNIQWGHLHLDNPAQVPQSMLQRWLREVHKIDLDAGTTFSKKYSFIGYQGQNPEPKFITDDFSTYELALEIALQQSLKLIP